MSDSVINWEEAMQQVGDDEEFLRELLADLRSETESQIAKIETIISRGSSPDDGDPFHAIMRAAHVIKGAAANLMCGQLREASMNLEQAASMAQGGAPTEPQKAAVQHHYNTMKQAGQNLMAYLQSIGV